MRKKWPVLASVHVIPDGSLPHVFAPIDRFWP